MRLRHSLQLLIASLSLGSLFLLGCSQNRQFGDPTSNQIANSYLAQPVPC
ncbi:MAG: hypothetical protein F6K32_20000 [Desertifilum sp. SIO1I2]|nr:hypothetical protein [Desertifilum sp. SIO1I2]